MVLRLDASTSEFETHFAAFLDRKRESASEVDAQAAQILAAVRTGGDKALAELTLRLDHTDLAQIPMRVAPREIDAAFASISEQQRAALELARDRIAAHHRK